MRSLDSSIARWIFAVLTVGVGIVTLRSQSDFWLGSLVTLLAAWIFEATGTLVAPPGRGHRTPALIFVVSSTLGLAIGFGPWSDASKRGALPNAAALMAPYRADIQPATFGFLFLRSYVGPAHRAEIRIDDTRRRIVADVTILGTRGGPSGPEMLAWDFETSLNPKLDIMTRTGTGAFYAITDESLKVYLDACYLLASLLLGWASAGIGALVLRIRRRRPGRST